MSNRWVHVLVATAFVAGAFEFVNAFFIDVPAAAVVFGALFVVGGAGVLRSNGIWACVLLGVLNLAELAFMPAYTWDTASDVIIQGSFATLTLVGLVAAAIVGRSRWGSRRHSVQARSA